MCCSCGGGTIDLPECVMLAIDGGNELINGAYQRDTRYESHGAAYWTRTDGRMVLRRASEGWDFCNAVDGAVAVDNCESGSAYGQLADDTGRPATGTISHSGGGDP